MYPQNRHLYGIIFILIFIGISILLYRHIVLNVPFTQKENITSWTIEANLNFVAQKDVPLKVSFLIPSSKSNFTLLDEYFVSQNYGVSVHFQDDNRKAVWSLRRSLGMQSLYYRAQFQPKEQPRVLTPKLPEIRDYSKLSESQKIALKGIIKKARLTSADIQTFAQSAVGILNKKDGDAKLLLNSDFSQQNLVKNIITVLNAVNIHAVEVNGIYLKEDSKASFNQLIAVYNGKSWFYINPHTAEISLPDNFLIWSYTNEPMFDVIGGKKPSFNVSVFKTPVNALELAKEKGIKAYSQLLRFSLLQLPVNVQKNYQILLMLPVGAFIILFLRNFIGIKTFGTFMPVLISLAFRETELFQGVLLFSFIVALGLLARFYLEHLRLLVIPRLAAILTIVIMLIIFLSVLGHNLNLEFGLSVALFPMVVLTMTIERMCVLWDERGANEAILSGIGSLFAAMVSFIVMNINSFRYLMFAFPELLLVMLGLIIWCGQYRGYRLFELLRFNALAGLKNVGDLR